MTKNYPEVHIIGEIKHGQQIKGKNLFAKFEIKSGDEWDVVDGDEKGQTQCDYPGSVCIVYISLYDDVSVCLTNIYK